MLKPDDLNYAIVVKTS